MKTNHVNVENIKAIFLVLIGFMTYAFMDALIKGLSSHYHLIQLVFFNALFALMPITIASYKVDRLKSLKINNLKLHVLRGIIMFGVTFCFFFGYKHLPLAQVYTIGFSSPFFITILSVLLLKEHVGRSKWAAVLVGFIGVVVLIYPERPDEIEMSYKALVPLCAVLGISFGVIIIRYLGRTNSSLGIAFTSNLTILTCAFLFLPFVFEMPNLKDFGLLALAGLLCGLADLHIFSGFKRAPSSVLAPFQYTQVLWGLLFGYLIWNDIPDRELLVGGGIIIASGLFIIAREAQLAKKQKLGTEVPQSTIFNPDER